MRFEKHSQRCEELASCHTGGLVVQWMHLPTRRAAACPAIACPASHSFNATLLNPICILSLAAGLAAIHSRGAVHGALKPHNVLVNGNFRDVAVCDAGLTAAYAATMEACNRPSNARAANNLPYLAPEQFCEQASDRGSRGRGTGERPPMHAFRSL